MSYKEANVKVWIIVDALIMFTVCALRTVYESILFQSD